jgi:hypothetical protein
MPKIMLESANWEIGAQDWLANRQRHITGTDAAIIRNGRNQYGKTVIDLYMDKKTEIPASIPDNEQMRIGRILEPVILNVYSRMSGMRIMKPDTFFEHDTIPYIGVNLDGWSEEKKICVEVKTTWHTEKYEQYYDQCRHENLVMDAKECHLLVFDKQVLADNTITADELADIQDTKKGELIIVSGLVKHLVPRDAAEESILLSRYAKFWECLQTETWPELADFGFGQINLLDPRVQYVIQYEKLSQIVKFFEGLKGSALGYIKEFGEVKDSNDFSTGFVKDSECFDEKKFAEENPELYKQYQKTKAGYFRVYPKKSIKNQVTEWMEKNLDSIGKDLLNSMIPQLEEKVKEQDGK